MITERLDEWYSTKGKLDSAERTWKFGPSNLGDCLRKGAHILSGVETSPLPPESVRVFELGHQRGEALEAAAKEIWPDAVSQVPVSVPIGKFTMNGTCDLWIPSLRTVVDFKTQSVFGFGLLDQEGASDDYRLQVHAYRDALSVMRLTDLSPREIRAVIVYEAKDSDSRKGIKGGMLKEIEVPFDDELEAMYRLRLSQIEKMLSKLESGTLDPKEYPELPRDKRGNKSWKCRFCSIGEERGGCYR